MKASKLKRNCQACNKIIIYRNTRCFNDANKHQKMCSGCAQVDGNDDNRKIFKTERNCPLCNYIIKYSSPLSCYQATRNVSVCSSCSTKTQWKNSENRKKKIESLKKIKHTKEWHAKIAKNRRKNGTYATKEETKEKHRIIKIERMLKDGILIWPSYNKQACALFDRIEKELGWDGQYATKGKEKRIGRYWVDYYEPNKNIIIEYDEKHHFDTNGELKSKDLERQKWIVSRTGCRFYRINENTNYEQFKHILLSDM